MQDLANQWGVNSVYFGKMNVHAYNKEIALAEDFLSGVEGEEVRTPPVCLNGWFYLIVKAGDDNTSTCCRIHQMRLGDFKKWSLKELWLSSKMMNMRLLGKYGQIQKMFKACQTCPYYDKNIERTKAVAELGINAKAIA